MASNNSRPNRFVPEGGGGWRKAPQSQQPRRSAKPSPKHGNNKGEVIRYLKELFDPVLDEEIIESVAESCGWNADCAVESLIELSNDVSISNHSLPGSRANQAKVVDQPRKAPPYKAPKPVQTITPSPAMAAIKVAYQGYDDDSDDADIIMEEEEEFEGVPLGNQRPPSLPDEHSSPLQPAPARRGPKECREVSTIRAHVAAGNRIAVLMRGCPGSGKTHLARALVATCLGRDPSPHVFSTDDYFCRSGRYSFDPAGLPAAHEWNQRNVAAAMRAGLSPVVVDNTNTMVWEMKSYARLAVQFGYAIELLEPTTPWRWTESELARRNSHGVARPAIRNMLDRYEAVTADELLTRLRLSYGAGNHPPQPCSNPVGKKAKSSPAKERKQNVVIPTVQLETKELPSSSAFKPKFDVTPLERNGDEASSVNKRLPVAENERTNDTRSHDLFTDLEPLEEAPLFKKVETVGQRETADQGKAAEPMAEVESLRSLVDIQDSAGWQLIESLDDIITVGGRESVGTPEETTAEPDPRDNLRHDVDFGPVPFEDTEETEETFGGHGGPGTDGDMESLERALGDAFDHAFNPPNEVSHSQQEAVDTPDVDHAFNLPFASNEVSHSQQEAMDTSNVDHAFNPLLTPNEVSQQEAMDSPIVDHVFNLLTTPNEVSQQEAMDTPNVDHALNLLSTLNEASQPEAVDSPIVDHVFNLLSTPNEVWQQEAMDTPNVDHALNLLSTPNEALLPEAMDTPNVDHALNLLSTPNEALLLEAMDSPIVDHVFNLLSISNEVSQREAVEINGNEDCDGSASPIGGRTLHDDRANRDVGVNPCLEYVLVGADRSLLCQKSHEEFDRRTEDVTKKVIELVLCESVGDIPVVDEDLARNSPVRLPGEIICHDATNPFMGLLEKVETSPNGYADLWLENDNAIKGTEEPVSRNIVDQLGDVENVAFRRSREVSETRPSDSGRPSSRGETGRCKSEPGEASPSADRKKVESVPPEKASTKLDLFSWFFAKKKPLPDLTESQQVGKDDGGPATAEKISAVQSVGLPDESQVDGATPTPDSTKWKLNSSWNHSIVEDGTLPTVNSAVKMLNSSTVRGDVICNTPVEIDVLKDTEEEKQSSELNSKVQTMPSVELSEPSSEDTANSSFKELEKQELSIVDNALDWLSEFPLGGEIPNALQETPIGSENGLTSSSNATTLEPPGPDDSEPGITSSSNASTVEPPVTVDSEPDLTSSSNAITVEPPITVDSQPDWISSSNASTVLEPPIDSQPDWTSSSNASTVEPPITVDSQPGLTSSSNASTVLEPPIDSETDTTSSSNASTVEPPITVDSQPHLTSSSNASTVLEPPIDSETDTTSTSNASTVEPPVPGITSSSNASTVEPPIDSEPDLTSSSNASTVEPPVPVDSEPETTSSSNASTVLEPPIDSEPDLTSSSNASTVLEPPVDSQPDLTSSSNASTALELPVDSEPDLTSSSDTETVLSTDGAIGSYVFEPTSDLTDRESATVNLTSRPEENVRLGGRYDRYAGAWSQMGPSNRPRDDEISRLEAEVHLKTPTRDSETNTSHSDFSLIGREGGEARRISGRRRSINTDVGGNGEINRTIATTATLDKGSMTAPEDFFESERPDFELLANMFPKIARELLAELFDKCQGEINWTVDLLLESGHAFEPSESLEIRFHNSEELQVTLEELDLRDTKRSVEGPVTRGFETCEADESDDGAAKVPSPSKRGNNNNNRRRTSELSLRLKREMERNIDLSDSSYSQETLRLKKIRHGTRPEQVREEVRDPSVTRPEQVHEQRDPNDRDPEPDEEEEGTVPFAPGADFLARLASLFGELDYPYPEGVTPVVDLPVPLARQIHAVLMDTQQRQFDMQEKYFADMIKDEEFARRLQAEEMPAPDLRQIMDMELALELYKADAARETRDDMATRLSRRKLAELFPTVDAEMLADVFAAHGHSFHETLEVLEASTGEPEEAARNVLSPEALARYERQLIDRARQESCKQRDIEEDQATCSAFERTMPTPASSKDQALQQAKLYREEANRQYQLRNRCYQQARDAMRNGQSAVASYYAQVGQLYKQYIDKANASAAASLLTAHTMCTSSTTLDLHYLFVVEALQALDIFIDHHISKLVDSGKSSQQLFLITGGGNHSVGGRPKIKPAVQKRLNHRGIKYSTLNLGQLRIVITRNMSLSNGNTIN